jgi:membrane protein
VTEAGPVRRARNKVENVRAWGERTLAWKIWERMLESEFVDRSIALAAKAFVSFFPLIIVVAAFLPDDVRKSIFTAVTGRLGMGGKALAEAKQAFATSTSVRRATGLLGLVFTFFYANSFTTALQRVYLRAWRRPPGGGATNYVRGPTWLAAIVVYFALLGGLRGVLDGPAGTALFLVVSLVAAVIVWWLTGWFMMRGQVRRRVLWASGIITGIAMSVYGATATLWMPGVVASHQRQFGFFGVALALVTWFSGAAICVVVGACAGAVLAEDPGIVGHWVRGPDPSLLTPGAPPSLGAPIRTPRLVDALGMRDVDDEDEEAIAGPTEPG